MQEDQKNQKEQKIQYRTLLFSMCLITLTGCAPQQSPEQFQPTTQIVEKPVMVRPPDIKMQYQFSYDNNPALKKAYQQYLNTGKAPDITTDGFKQFAYGVGRQPIITASPLELTVVSLEPGEKVTNVSSGDPLRWSYSLAYSGQDKMRQAHVMVKPSQQDISTDLVITTDKRMYTLKMTTDKGGSYVRDVRFWYPEEMQDYWNNYNVEQTQKLNQEQSTTIAEVPNINLNNMNFAYKFDHSGWSTPDWQPVRVFDDGTHTYLQFSSSVSSRDLPALFILNGKSQELVNYRSKPPYFVVDKIFKKAVLVSGVGSSQTTVTITNYRY
jgi:type IV secretion system protein VirB9